MRRTNFVVLILIALGLSGCATVPKNLVNIESTYNSPLLLNTAVARSMLLSQYEEWKGTKYRYGGMDKDGIDCSGFIYQTYLTRFGIKLPRQSIIQGKVGRNVPTDSLLPGDLIFFKTGFFTSHIGIYMDNGKFLHVSKSLGVTMSDLKEPYWQRRYWKARRISVS